MAAAAAPLSTVSSEPASPASRAILVAQEALPNSGTVTEVIDAGRLITEIGIAPVKPAEFIIFRIGQWAGGAETEEAAEGEESAES
mgnify:CR=1 FL=1